MVERKTVSQCVSADYCKGWNDAVDAMSKWISVEERLPEPYRKVLTLRGFSDTGRYIYALDSTTLWIDDTLVWNGDLKTWKNSVTHWMPLPSAEGIE